MAHNPYTFKGRTNLTQKEAQSLFNELLHDEYVSGRTKKEGIQNVNNYFKKMNYTLPRKHYNFWKKSARDDYKKKKGNPISVSTGSLVVLSALAAGFYYWWKSKNPVVATNTTNLFINPAAIKKISESIPLGGY